MRTTHESTSRRAGGSSRLTALALVFAGCASGGAEPAETPGDPTAAETMAAQPAAAMSSFSTAQVERGRTRFDAVCAECHATSEFRGTNFRYEWRRRTAWDFYRTVSSTMPEDAPGSLADAEYVDVIAWILEMNGFQAGAADLPATEAALDQFVMDGAPGR